MKTIDALKVLEGIEKAVFSVNDLAKIIKKSRRYASLFTYRLKKRDLISELEKGKYALIKTHPYVIASNLIYPSYISFLTAFSYYNLITQIPKQIQVVSLKSKKELAFDNYSIKFIKFKPERFFGYKREKFSYGFVFVAELEKAIVDSLLVPRYCPVDESNNVLMSGKIDIEKLIDYALKIKNKVVLKRVGFLLEKNGIDVHKRLKNELNNKYEVLDTNLIKRGKKDKRWKLIINRKL